MMLGSASGARIEGARFEGARGSAPGSPSIPRMAMALGDVSWGLSLREAPRLGARGGRRIVDCRRSKTAALWSACCAILAMLYAMRAESAASHTKALHERNHGINSSTRLSKPPSFASHGHVVSSESGIRCFAHKSAARAGSDVSNRLRKAPAFASLLAGPVLQKQKEEAKEQGEGSKEKRSLWLPFGHVWELEGGISCFVRKGTARGE
jgi:hypothetical protein